MPAPISLDLLPVFVSVARHRSFTRAAAELDLPRSSVSRRISSLEETLSVELFVRSTRRVDLTTAGLRLLARVQGPLDELHDALATMPERSDEPAGALRITAPADIGMRLLPPVLGALTGRYPAIHPEVELSNRVVDLEGEGFDVALRVSMSRLPDSSLRVRVLGEIHTALYGAPAYLERRGRPADVDALALHELVRIAGPAPTGAHQRPTVSADDMLLAARMVEQGVGLAVLPTFLAAEAVAAGRLERLLPDVDFGTGTLFAVFPSTRHLPGKTTAFRDALLQWLSDHPLPDLR